MKKEINRLWIFELILSRKKSHAFISWPIFKAHPESPLKPKPFRLYNRELGKIKGFVPFLLFNVIFLGFGLTPILTLLVNIVTEYGVTRTQAGNLFMVIFSTETIFRMVRG